MKRLLLAFFSLCIAAAANAQADYSFSTFTDTYIEISEENLAVNFSWDDPTYSVPIGFDFNLMGTTTGFLHSNDTFLGGTLIANEEIVAWDLLWVTTLDVIDAGYAMNTFESPISYITEGEPGSRIFKMQWKDVGLYDEYDAEGTANNKLNFQLWLYEGSNDIEVRWGPNTVKETFYITNVWNSCGLLDDAVSEGSFGGGLFVTGTPMSPTALNIENENDFFSVQILGLPENGRVYRFEAGALSIDAVETADANLRVYPTAVHDFVYVDGLQSGAFSVDVLSPDGRHVQRDQAISGQALNLSHLPTGMYLITIEQGKIRKTARIFKN